MLFLWKLGSFSSRVGSSWLVITNELKSWHGSTHYHNEPSQAESSQPQAEQPNELQVFRLALPQSQRAVTLSDP